MRFAVLLLAVAAATPPSGDATSSHLQRDQSAADSFATIVKSGAKVLKSALMLLKSRGKRVAPSPSPFPSSALLQAMSHETRDGSAAPGDAEAPEANDPNAPQPTTENDNKPGFPPTRRRRNKEKLQATGDDPDWINGVRQTDKMKKDRKQDRKVRILEDYVNEINIQMNRTKTAIAALAPNISKNDLAIDNLKSKHRDFMSKLNTWRKSTGGHTRNFLRDWKKKNDKYIAEMNAQHAANTEGMKKGREKMKEGIAHFEDNLLPKSTEKMNGWVNEYFHPDTGHFARSLRNLQDLMYKISTKQADKQEEIKEDFFESLSGFKKQYRDLLDDQEMFNTEQGYMYEAKLDNLKAMGERVLEIAEEIQETMDEYWAYLADKEEEGLQKMREHKRDSNGFLREISGESMEMVTDEADTATDDLESMIDEWTLEDLGAKDRMKELLDEALTEGEDGFGELDLEASQSELDTDRQANKLMTKNRKVVEKAKEEAKRMAKEGLLFRKALDSTSNELKEMKEDSNRTQGNFDTSLRRSTTKAKANIFQRLGMAEEAGRNQMLTVESNSNAGVRSEGKSMNRDGKNFQGSTNDEANSFRRDERKVHDEMGTLEKNTENTESTLEHDAESQQHRIDEVNGERKHAMETLESEQGTLGSDAQANEDAAKQVQGALLSGAAGAFAKNAEEAASTANAAGAEYANHSKNMIGQVTLSAEETRKLIDTTSPAENVKAISDLAVKLGTDIGTARKMAEDLKRNRDSVMNGVTLSLSTATSEAKEGVAKAAGNFKAKVTYSIKAHEESGRQKLVKFGTVANAAIDGYGAAVKKFGAEAQDLEGRASASITGYTEEAQADGAAMSRIDSLGKTRAANMKSTIDEYQAQGQAAFVSDRTALEAGASEARDAFGRRVDKADQNYQVLQDQDTEATNQMTHGMVTTFRRDESQLNDATGRSAIENQAGLDRLAEQSRSLRSNAAAERAEVENSAGTFLDSFKRMDNSLRDWWLEENRTADEMASATAAKFRQLEGSMDATLKGVSEEEKEQLRSVMRAMHGKMEDVAKRTDLSQKEKKEMLAKLSADAQQAVAGTLSKMEGMREGVQDWAKQATESEEGEMQWVEQGESMAADLLKEQEKGSGDARGAGMEQSKEVLRDVTGAIRTAEEMHMLQAAQRERHRQASNAAIREANAALRGEFAGADGELANAETMGKNVADHARWAAEREGLIMRRTSTMIGDLDEEEQNQVQEIALAIQRAQEKANGTDLQVSAERKELLKDLDDLLDQAEYLGRAVFKKRAEQTEASQERFVNALKSMQDKSLADLIGEQTFGDEWNSPPPAPPAAAASPASAAAEGGAAGVAAGAAAGGAAAGGAGAPTSSNQQTGSNQPQGIENVPLTPPGVAPATALGEIHARRAGSLLSIQKASQRAIAGPLLELQEDVPAAAEGSLPNVHGALKQLRSFLSEAQQPTAVEKELAEFSERESAVRARRDEATAENRQLMRELESASI